MALARIKIRGRKRGELIVYDSYQNWRPHRRSFWLTLYNAGEVVLHCRLSDIEEIELIN